jgi:hypothetical protein
MEYRVSRMGLALYSTLPCGLGVCDGEGRKGWVGSEGGDEREK